jgi:general secretion pathway protein H
MTKAIDARGESTQSGFTLIELLVVLGMLALALAVVAPSLHRARSGPVVRSAAHELAGTLRAVRAATQISNVEHVLTIDVAGRQYWAEGVAPRRQLPEQVHLDLWVPDSERIGTSGRVRFFPDGSASGARVVLQDAQSSTAVFVDWLNGDVRVHMRQ